MGHIEREMRHKSEPRKKFFYAFQLPQVLEGVVAVDYSWEFKLYLKDTLL